MDPMPRLSTSAPQKHQNDKPPTRPPESYRNEWWGHAPLDQSVSNLAKHRHVRAEAKPCGRGPESYVSYMWQGGVREL